MPRKRKSDPPAVSIEDAAEASLLLVEHRKAKGGMGRVNPGASKAASLLAKRRMALLTKKEHLAMSRKGARSYWDSMTPEERSLECRRRAATRKANQRKARRKKIAGR